MTLNLSPADLRKEGTGFDLAIAAAILTAYGIIPSPEETWLFLGELGLDGRIKGIPGALTLTVRARELGFTRLFLPGRESGGGVHDPGDRPGGSWGS